MSDPKVLVLDIETAPLVAYVWGLKDQNVALNQIQRDSFVMAWAAKWLNTPSSAVMYKDQRDSKNLENDKELLLPLWKLLDEAEIVITQYGSGFDGPTLNARFITHGMQPPQPYKHLDTYRIVKRVAKFTSNKLEYLTGKLCTKYKKLKHNKYPGMSLWKECLSGNQDAWNEMKRYNIHDVLSTEELYNKIRAWAPQSMPSVHRVAKVTEKCRVCGEPDHMQRRGFVYTLNCKYQNYQCKKCGSWTRGERTNEQ